MTHITDLLDQRKKTHGDYSDVARFCQGLKAYFRLGHNWDAMNDSQKEALDMMCSKYARMMCGDKDFRDHWDDLAGYATLGGMFSDDSRSTNIQDMSQFLKDAVPDPENVTAKHAPISIFGKKKVEAS